MTTPRPHIMLFESSAGGHHGQYIMQLVDYWKTSGASGLLSVVIPPEFLEKHHDVMSAISSNSSDSVRIHLLSKNIRHVRKHSFGVLMRSQREQGRLFGEYIQRLRPDHSLCMHFDHVQIPLAVGLKFDFDTQISGIYFRPYHPSTRADAGSDGGQQRLLGLRKRWLLRASLRNPHFSTLFSLNPDAVSGLQSLFPRTRIVALPDGVPAQRKPTAPVDLRRRYSIDPERRLAVLFGSIAERKGVFQILEALRMLSSGEQDNLSVILIGSVSPGDRDRLNLLVPQLRAETNVQIVVDDRFVAEEEIQGILGSSDLLLLPYQRHAGSSGVLIRAAMAGVPVLGPEYGLVGEHIRKNSLGQAVDTSSPSILASSLAAWLANPHTISFDPLNAQRFADANTATKFSETIFGALFSKSP